MKRIVREEVEFDYYTLAACDAPKSKYFRNELTNLLAFHFGGGWIRDLFFSAFARNLRLFSANDCRSSSKLLLRRDVIDLELCRRVLLLLSVVVGCGS